MQELFGSVFRFNIFGEQNNGQSPIQFDKEVFAAQRQELIELIEGKRQEIYNLSVYSSPQMNKTYWSEPLKNTHSLIESLPTTKLKESSGEQDLDLLLSLGKIFYGRESLSSHSLQVLLRPSLEDYTAYENFRNLLVFTYLYSPQIRINGITLDTLLDKNQNIAPSRFLKYVMGCVIADSRADYTQIILENQESPLTKEYNQIFLNHIERVVTFPSAMIFGDISQLEGAIKRSSGVTKDAAKTAHALTKQFRKTASTINTVFFDPRSSEFDALKDAVLSFSDLNNYESTYLLYLLGATSTSSIREMYGICKKNIETGIEPEFYANILDMLYEYIASNKLGATFLTKNDLSLIKQDSSQEENTSIAAVESFPARAHSIFSISSNSTYAFESEEIEWGDIIPPEDFRVEFNGARPSNFRLLLTYAYGENDPLQAIFEFFPNKGTTFKWSFIEHTDELPDLYAKVTNLADQALHIISMRAQEIAHNKQRIHHRAENIQPKRRSAPRKISSPDPRGPWQQSNPTNPDTPIVESLRSERRKETKPLVRVQVSVPDIEEWEKLVSRFSSENQDIIAKAISKFNEHSLGDFGKLELCDKFGQRYHVLRLRSTKPQVRVFLLPTGAGNTFEIDKILYRHEAY